MNSLEAEGALPSSMLAYRHSMSAQHGVLFTWLLLWRWCSHHDVYVIDWDESNAFCNVPRADMGALDLGYASRFVSWAVDHYELFWVRVLTPHGTSSPFPLYHG